MGKYNPLIHEQKKVYSSYNNIKNRVFNPNHPDWKYYGARGITMQEDYRKSFNLFFEEVGPPPEPIEGVIFSIDRIDGAKGYVKGNMRWASNTQQVRNLSKRKDNSTGITGVYPNHAGRGIHYMTATWYPISDEGKCKKLSKHFSVNKLGITEAFKQAVLHRRFEMLKLQCKGADYSYKHGQ